MDRRSFLTRAANRAVRISSDNGAELAFTRLDEFDPP